VSVVLHVFDLQFGTERAAAIAAPGTCQVEQWDFAAGQRAFVLAAVTPLTPARAPAAASSMAPPA
jgi:hypothetical protein